MPAHCPPSSKWVPGGNSGEGGEERWRGKVARKGGEERWRGKVARKGGEERGRGKSASKGSGYPTSLCRQLRISVLSNGHSPMYGIVYGTILYLFYRKVNYKKTNSIHSYIRLELCSRLSSTLISQGKPWIHYICREKTNQIIMTFNPLL